MLKFTSARTIPCLLFLLVSYWPINLLSINCIYATGRLVQNLAQVRGGGRRLTTENESSSNVEPRNIRRPSSSSVAGGLPPLVRYLHFNPLSDT